MPLCELYEPNRDFLEDGSVMVQANVSVPRVVDCWSPESKKETAFVGLMNQGATCYMNSLLQTLYHIPYFRKAVYHMPTTKNDEPSGNIPLALQSLFYKLQYSDTSVATKELMESFGWDAYDSFMQHDAQEFSRLLCERIEDKMKGTTLDGTIQQLFEGHQVSHMECINVDYKSSIKEFFYDLQLDVKGCPDVYASFDKYVEVECLEGYHVDLHGLQDAKKHVLFIDFPPVLQLQLKRFEYDVIRNTMVKINDRYEFPLQLDLDRENGKYLSPKADRSVRNRYTLHSVLVHSGRVDGGHYYVYVRPTLSDQWFKFDDDRVTEEVMKRALEEQFGGKEEIPKCSNAYMLVYIRESDKEKIICDVDEKDIPQHLKTKLKKEQEEKEQRRKEKAEAHPYTIVKVAHHKDLLRQIGKDIYFDLVDLEKVAHFQIQNQMSFHHLKEQVAEAYRIPMQIQRFWLWAYSRNRTYRPRLPLPPQAEALSVGYFGEFSIEEKELNLFLDEDIRVLVDGDIIWFQKSSEAGNGEQFRYPDVPSFLEYVHNRQVVHFRTLEKPHKDEFLLELSKLHKYDEVVERVAGHLGLDDPLKIRLTSHNCYSQKPKLQPIKYCEAECLSDMLVHYNETSIIPTSDILYYEVLDIPLPELLGLKTLKVVFHHDSKAEVSNLTITLPKQSTIGDVLDDLKTKVELSHPNAELRLLEVFCHKIYKIFPLKLMIENIDDQYWTLHAEEIPEEEKNFGPYDGLIHVSHFMKTMTVNQVQVQNFGEPFLLVISEGETLAEVKVRIQKKLQVLDEEFLKWKFAFFSSGRPEYLQDSDILSSHFLKRDIYDDPEQYLGLEHRNNASKSSYAVNQNHQKEKALKIYN